MMIHSLNLNLKVYRCILVCLGKKCVKKLTNNYLEQSIKYLKVKVKNFV
jgi:hypothetical protein